MAAYFRRDGTVNTSQGIAVTGALIYVCTQPASVGQLPSVLPSPLATLFADPNGVTPLANPVIADGNGNYFLYALTGVYTLVIFDPLGRITQQVFADQQVTSQGGGSVTSVAMTGDGTVLNSVVPGSPISASGTLAPTLVPFAAHAILIGPTSGPSAAPTARVLQASDLPGGTGTVSSVGLSVNPGALLTQSVTGSPVTGSGTLSLTLGVANQNPNSFLGGPASGAAGPTTSRTLVAADIYGTVPTSFSATPTFNAAAFASPLFTMTLTGNVTSSTVTNPTLGQVIAFEITQDATGGRTFAWPANFKGASNIGSNANDVSVQEFRWDGNFWRATSPGMVVNT